MPLRVPGYDKGEPKIYGFSRSLVGVPLKLHKDYWGERGIRQSVLNIEI